MGVKFWRVTSDNIGYHIECSGTKKKLITESVNKPQDVLSLINPSLANVYFSTTLSNHGAIRLKSFVSQISRYLCN
jgi:hypothetical protein